MESVPDLEVYAGPNPDTYLTHKFETSQCWQHLIIIIILIIIIDNIK